ncbi:3332_t:CDS:1 [Ambispora leptoticha]|uniref:3332_t:CDS:1 n=1 Tax=Ambispora leptoticha TaxID=144679 RepID=A0A9N8ZEK7_9GLOM|nr:3332_t:CDS:1 [Ambispora leptoticha]
MDFVTWYEIARCLQSSWGLQFFYVWSLGLASRDPVARIEFKAYHSIPYVLMNRILDSEPKDARHEIIHGENSKSTIIVEQPAIIYHVTQSMMEIHVANILLM